ncbi:DNA-binding transcriptional regulator, LysR family [Rhizobium sp. RU20A]|uniref:LysR family transcriptional regulator n=1 Tax=Rhizobium sp. RU20A TaxID=1907412 RepID=UPI000953F04C|nr:LysR family transcriptional regulator [Rhizobium sp. RU20A]SIR24273.1 DNA-binding transcriptional regulator, LysR family [Rhizobium sp. RU20A]
MIKLEALRVFVTVAESGNIKDAADAVGRTASAVSMTLKQLEDEIGGPLFQTDRKNCLTALGTLMLDLGREQIRSFDKSVGVMRAFAHSRIGSLSIASVPSVATNVLPSILQRFLETRPQVQLELFDIDSAQVRRMVESGTADLGFAGESRSGGSVAFTPLFSDRLKLLCRDDHDLCLLDRPVDWSDLEDITLIRNGASDRIEAEDYRRISARSLITVYNVTSLVALVRAGVGLTILPSLTMHGTHDGVAALDLADDAAHRQLGLVERRDVPPSPVAAAFRAFALNEIPALACRISK